MSKTQAYTYEECVSLWLFAPASSLVKKFQQRSCNLFVLADVHQGEQISRGFAISFSPPSMLLKVNRSLVPNRKLSEACDDTLISADVLEQATRTCWGIAS